MRERQVATCRAVDIDRMAQESRRQPRGWRLLLVSLLASRTAVLGLQAIRSRPSQHREVAYNSKSRTYVPLPAPEVTDRQRRIMGASLLSSVLYYPTTSAEAKTGEITLVLQQPSDKVGLELYDVTIGTPPKSTVAIRRVLSNNRFLQEGMVLVGYSSAAEVVQRVRSGPYPISLTFRNLAAAGDAIADDEKPLLTAQDALQLARRQSGEINANVIPGPAFAVTVLRPADGTCEMRSRRNDVLEINYEARVTNPDNGVVYDASASRGTGRPYQMVLGSGDMLPGVDQGLYEMCPGEVREIVIPPQLSYGPRGNKLFRIPPDSTLLWKVELVSVNDVRKGDTRTRSEIEGRE